MSNSFQLNKSNAWFVVLLLMGIINVFINIIPLLPFAIIIIFTQFIFQNKADWAFLLVFFQLFGAFFTNHGIRGIGSILNMIGFIVLLPDLIGKITSIQKPILYSILLLLLLLFSVIVSTGGDMAGEKYITTLSNAFFCLVAFGHLMLFPKKHDHLSLSLMALIYSTFMLSYLSNQIGGLSIVDVFSFGSFRKDIGAVRLENEDLFLYGYQHIGLCVCLGFCFYFSNKKNRLDLIGWLIVAVSGLIVIGCQSRQGLFTYLILLVLFFVDIEHRNKSNVLILGGVLLLAYLWLDSLTMDTLDFLTGQNEFTTTSARYSIRQSAWEQFLSNPIIGVGYGRFYYDNVYGVNVHNIVYELLAETGVVGLTIVVVLIIRSLKSIGFRKLLGEYKWLFCIMIAYFMRLMVSSDMREGIKLLVIVFLVNSISNNKQTKVIPQ